MMKPVFIFIHIMIFLTSLFSTDTSLKLSTPETSFYSSKVLMNGGVFPDLVQNILSPMGYDVDFEFVPWKRAYELTKTGYYNGLLVTSYKAEREEDFIYSDIVFQENCALFCLKDLSFPDLPFDELEGYSFGVIRGSLVFNLLLEMELTTEEVKDHDQNIRKLLAGRVDFIVGNEQSILQILKENYIESMESIVMLNPYFHVGSLHFAAPREFAESQEIIKDFNTGLNHIRENGKFDTIINSHGFGD